MGRRKTSNEGFTLIELMIAVAVVGILAAIAYPSYQEQVRKSRRGDAHAALLENTQFMERVYSQNNRYNPGNQPPDLPITTLPRDGGVTWYNIVLSSVNRNNYNIEAVPTGVQAVDRCGTLTLNRIGVRGIKNAKSGVSPSDCW